MMVVQAPPPIVSFTHLPAAWHAFPSGNGGHGAYALSWRYRPNSAGWAPSMPRNAIAVNVFFPSEARRYPPLKLVMPKTPATTLDGAPDTPEYHIH